MSDYNYIDMVRLCNKTAWEIADRRGKKMNDLISRQAAIKALCEKGMCGDKHCDIYPCEDVRAIEQVPTIDPVKREKWIGGDGNYGRKWFRCSSCDESMVIPTQIGKPTFDYCPNCGARMDL